MSQDTERLVEGLERVFDDPAPPTSVDAAYLVERGHLLLRRRRAAGALSAVATAVVAVLVTTALPGFAARPVQPGQSGIGPSMLNPARFGWLPKAPDAYQYEVDANVSTVTAAWANEPSPQGPQLTLFTAGRAGATPEVRDTYSAKDQPTEVGIIGGNPVWYYGYTVVFPYGGPYHDVLVWKTASGDWAVLQDSQVDGPTLLHIASTADTTPTPLSVPLMPAGELAKLSAYNLTSIQTPDDSGLEYTLEGNLGDENIGIMGFAGDTGLATMNGTKCDFVEISRLGSYQKPCNSGIAIPQEGESFSPAATPSTTASPSINMLLSSSPAPGGPFQAASKVINGIDVYVSVYVKQGYSRRLSAERLGEVTSFGPDPADWQPAIFGQ